MANIQRGEADFEFEGKRYTLVFDHNALAEAEDAAGLAINDLMAEIQVSQRIKHVRALVYGGLRARHPELTLADAGNLLAAEGPLGEAIAKALAGAFPQIAKGDGKAKGNPRKPR